MERITKTSLFKLSVIGSLLAFFSVMFGDKFFSELWIIYAFIALPIILFFTITLIYSLIFWLKKRKKYNYPYIPFCVNVITACLILLLPLNYIRNRIGFFVYHNSYEKAFDIVNKAKIDSSTIYRLPNEYASLSVGGGEVYVVKKSNEKTVLFYTFRGAPDGAMGFVKIANEKSFHLINGELFDEIYEIKDLGNNWYYVQGN